ncbi:MAG: hypothetical protein DMF12_08450 [Verrucomicrobia bacterium]|nr:MAG: hypothetical protein AUH19_05145 [Verrucomicrobia bacterium 13_2_20CM_55_10]OLB18788.1 MAG: hypothetical protein AUI05_01960 [Verrucomicrobia bacterium 13_2_20CM_2_54_15_9cls]PYI41917.1 MAG: hypothetical protein DMF12_08450 [Verrucomicrobiota bacterium]PYI67763.1 MAG: hypothetical protein DMF07_02305 [Verrucomicrobiota bacterium]
MAMFRRSRRSTSPLRHKQQQIARQEAELRERLEQLERMVTRGTTAQNESSARGEEQGARRNKTDKRFQVSVAFEPAHSLDATRRPRSLRKERREGRIIFLFLLVALAVAVMWLISHLHS